MVFSEHILQSTQYANKISRDKVTTVKYRMDKMSPNVNILLFIILINIIIYKQVLLKSTVNNFFSKNISIYTYYFTRILQFIYLSFLMNFDYSLLCII